MSVYKDRGPKETLWIFTNPHTAMLQYIFFANVLELNNLNLICAMAPLPTKNIDCKRFYEGHISDNG